MHSAALEPYVPRVIEEAARRTWAIEGSLVFADVSGFTKLSEKLAEQGKAGAEELTDILLGTFTDLLGEAGAEGGDLLKFGGDALLLAFVGDGHAVRACRAAIAMRAALTARGPVQTGKGRVHLRISQGVHSGRFQLVLAGDRQRELLVIGPDATAVTEMESAAEAGEVLVSERTAALLAGSSLGTRKGPGFLLRRKPPAVPVPQSQAVHLDRTNLVPPDVRARIDAGDLESEHRRVAIGFVQVLGVDECLAAQGPDAVAAALHEVTSAVETAAAETGVCLLASDIAPNGVKLILTAGAPAAVEDAEGQLLLCLRNAFDAAQTLPLRAGAHAGHVFAGDVGAPWRHVYTVIGDAVNLSARLMGKAAPGQIVASKALLDQSALLFASEPLAPFMVKGKRHPQEASVVGARREGRGRSSVLRTPFVGRERELELLHRAVAAAATGHGSCMEIVGGPGLGKSRLVEELLSASAGLRHIGITCEPFQADRPYFVARLLLRRILDVPLDADREVAGLALASRVSEVAPELAAWLPLLAAAMDAAADETPETLRLDPAYRAQALNEAAAALLGSALTEPALIVFEDAGWMDEASAQLLARALQTVEQRPWCVVSTLRTTDSGLHQGLGFQAERIELGPLAAGVALELAATVTEQLGVSSRELEAMSARAAGNPFYLVELLRARVEAGSIDELPGGLEDVITARIDRLPQVDRRVLRFAAVLGDRFSPALLQATLGDELPYDVARIPERLGEYLVVHAGDLRFEHDLVREVAYEGLPFARRRHLHRRIATALTALPGRPDDDRLSLLARHWDLAGESLEAWRALRRAGDRARRKFAHHEASVLYERAIDNARKARLVSTVELAEVAETMGDEAELAARYDAASSGYRLARRLRDHDDLRQVALLRKEGLVRERSGKYGAALSWLRRGLADARRWPDEQVAGTRAELEVAYAGVCFRQGRLRDCVRWCERAIADAERAGERKTLAHALYLIEGALTDLGDERAKAYTGRSLAIYRSLGDSLGMGHALLNMGVNAVHEGRLDEAVELYGMCRDALRDAGHVIGLAHVSLNLGEILSDQGRLEEAERLLKDARRGAMAAGYPMVRWAAVSGLGRVAVRDRRVAEGLELLDSAGSAFEAMGASTWAAEVLARIAEAHMFAGAWDRAIEVAQTALDLGSEAAAGGIGPLLHRVRGRAQAARGDLDGARRSFEQSLAEARSTHAHFEVALTLVEVSQLTDVDPQQSERAGSEAQEIAWRLGVALDVVCPPPLPRVTSSGR